MMTWCLMATFAVSQVPNPPAPPAAPTEPPAAAAEPETPPPEPGFVMKVLQGTHMGGFMEEQRLAIYGWTNMSYTPSTNRITNLPMGMNYRPNEFLLQQNTIRFDRAVDTKASSATFGFRTETLLPGSDYRFTLARGLYDSQLTGNNGGPHLYGIDPVQFYGEGYFPNVAKGLDVKIGRFYAQYGVESIDPTANVFGSHSYTSFYNPFTHTGVLTTLQLTDDVSVQNGVVTGSDVFLDSAANTTYIGSVKWAPTDGDTSVLLAVIVGRGRFDSGEAFHNPNVFDLVVTKKLTEKLTWSGEGLYGYTRRVPGIGFANWFGVVNYLTYAVNDELSGTTRVEFFDDSQGQRTGFEGLYTAVTGGINYKPKSWLWIRPEVRIDHNDSRPFDGKPVLFTAGLDVVLRW